jgi:hypothetical protein
MPAHEGRRETFGRTWKAGPGGRCNAAGEHLFAGALRTAVRRTLFRSVKQSASVVSMLQMYGTVPSTDLARPA